jgi:hypothetical protein
MVRGSDAGRLVDGSRLRRPVNKRDYGGFCLSPTWNVKVGAGTDTPGYLFNFSLWVGSTPADDISGRLG